MTATFSCPNGHQSTTADYCDQCGAKMGPSGATAGPGAPVEAAPESPAAGAAEPCPACGAARVGADRFCEGCGYDFVNGHVVSAGAAAAGGAVAGAAWEAVISADRLYFDAVARPDAVFPPHCPDRRFPLGGAQLRIGRRSSSRGIYPEIDLSGAPEDSAVSHLHALLVQGTDGSYSVVDPGSTNGTTVNDDPTPIPANVPVPLADGDRIHIGAWTTITVSRLPSPSG